MKAYYAQKDNYVTATGTVDFINYSEEGDVLHIGFSDLTPGFSDCAFKIVGENLRIVQENGIDEKLQMGQKIEFVSATKYFGDGYVMPIVAITIHGETLLEFDEGFENLQEWLKTQ